jgi:hypothetical protein
MSYTGHTFNLQVWSMHTYIYNVSTSLGMNNFYAFTFPFYIDEFKIYAACSNSCVERAPHAFTFVSSTGTARASSQG